MKWNFGNISQVNPTQKKALTTLLPQPYRFVANKSIDYSQKKKPTLKPTPKLWQTKEEFNRIANVLAAEGIGDPFGQIAKLNTYNSNRRKGETLADAAERVSTGFRLKSSQYRKAKDKTHNFVEKLAFKNVENTLTNFKPDPDWDRPYHENYDLSAYKGKTEKEIDKTLEKLWGDVDTKSKIKVGKEYYFKRKKKIPVIQKGSKETDKIIKIQNKLKEKGYKIEADGVFGDITEDAVKDYQEKQRLEVDGKVGKDTQKKMKLDLSFLKDFFVKKAYAGEWDFGDIGKTKATKWDYGNIGEKQTVEWNYGDIGKAKSALSKKETDWLSKVKLTEIPWQLTEEEYPDIDEQKARELKEAKLPAFGRFIARFADVSGEDLKQAVKFPSEYKGILPDKFGRALERAVPLATPAGRRAVGTALNVAFEPFTRVFQHLPANVLTEWEISVEKSGAEIHKPETWNKETFGKFLKLSTSAKAIAPLWKSKIPTKERRRLADVFRLYYKGLDIPETKLNQAMAEVGGVGIRLLMPDMLFAAGKGIRKFLRLGGKGIKETGKFSVEAADFVAGKIQNGIASHQARVDWLKFAPKKFNISKAVAKQSLRDLDNFIKSAQSTGLKPEYTTQQLFGIKRPALVQPADIKMGAKPVQTGYRPHPVRLYENKELTNAMKIAKGPDVKSLVAIRGGEKVGSVIYRITPEGKIDIDPKQVDELSQKQEIGTEIVKEVAKREGKEVAPFTKPSEAGKKLENKLIREGVVKPTSIAPQIVPKDVKLPKLATGIAKKGVVPTDKTIPKELAKGIEVDLRTWKRLSDMPDWAVKDELGYIPKELKVYHYGKNDIKRGSYVSTDQYYAESFKEAGDKLFIKTISTEDLKAYGEGRIIGRNRLNRKAEGVELLYDPKQTVPKELEPLAKEARKYKSAEEFVDKITKPEKEVFAIPERFNIFLKQIRDEVDAGKAGYRYTKEVEEAGVLTKKWEGVSSTFSDYFKNKGWTKKEVLGIIDKVLIKQPITLRQKGVMEDLLEAIKDKRIYMAEKLRETRKIKLPDTETSIETNEYGSIETIYLKAGYKVIRNGEEYTIEQGKEPGTLIIKNGETLELDDTFGVLDKVERIIAAEEKPFLETTEKGEKQTLIAGTEKRELPSIGLKTKAGQVVPSQLLEGFQSKAADLNKQAIQYIKNINDKSRKSFTQIRDSYKIISDFAKAGIIEGDNSTFFTTSIQGLIDEIRKIDTLPALETLQNNIRKANYPKTQQAVLLAEYYLRKDALNKAIEAEKVNNKFRIEKLGGLKRIMNLHPSELSQIKSKVNKLAVAYHNPQFKDLQREIKKSLDTEMVKFIKKITVIGLRSRGALDLQDDVSNEMYILYAKKLWRNFSPAMEQGLSSYVDASIKNRINDALDRLRGVSPAQAQDIRKVGKLIREFTLTNEKIPTTDEIASAFKWSKEKALAVLENAKLQHPVSVDAPINPEEELTYGEVLQSPVHYDQNEIEGFEALIKEAEDFIATRNVIEQTIFKSVLTGKKFEDIAAEVNLSVPEIMKKWNKIGLGIREYIKENPDREQTMVKILSNLQDKMHQRESNFMNEAGFMRMPDKSEIAEMMKSFENYAKELGLKIPVPMDKYRKTLYYLSRAFRLAQTNTLFKPIFDTVLEEGVRKIDKLEIAMGKINYQRKIAVRKGANIRSHYIRKNYKKAIKHGEQLIVNALVEGKAIMRYLTNAELKQRGFNESEIIAYKWMIKQQKFITELFKQLQYEKLGLKDQKFENALNDLKELLGWNENQIGVASAEKFDEVLSIKMSEASPERIARLEKTLPLIQTWREKFQHLQAIFARFNDGWFSMQRLMSKDGYHWAVSAKHSKKTYQLMLSEEKILEPTEPSKNAWFKTFNNRKEALAFKQELIEKGFKDVHFIETQKMVLPTNVLQYKEFLSLPALQSTVDSLREKGRILTEKDQKLIDELEEEIRDRLTPGYLKRFRWIKGWHTNLEEINRVIINSFQSASTQLSRARVERIVKPLLEDIQNSELASSYTMFNFAMEYVQNFVNPPKTFITAALLRRIMYTYFIGPKAAFGLLQATQNYTLGIPVLSRWLTLRTGKAIKPGLDANIETHKAAPQAINYVVKMYLNAGIHHIIDGVSLTFPASKRKQILEWWEKREQIHPDIDTENRTQIKMYQKIIAKLPKASPLDPEVKTMLDKMADRGVLNANMAEFLMALEEGRLEPTKSEIAAKILNFIPMSTETFNRTLTAITTLRLAKKDNLSFNEALQTEAETNVNDAQILYNNINNPLVLSSAGAIKGVLKVFYIFMSFEHEMFQAILNASGASIQSLGAGWKGELTKEEKIKEWTNFKANANFLFWNAIWQLFWGGIRSLPITGTILIYLLRKIKKRNLDEEVRKMTKDKWHLPPKVADTMANVIMAGMPNSVGINMSYSIQLGGLRSPAVAGFIKRIFRAGKKLKRGDFNGWAEDITPIFASSFLKSIRYAEEGGVRYKGYRSPRMRGREELYGVDEGKLPLSRLELLLKAFAFPLSKEYQLWQLREDSSLKEKRRVQSIYAERMARAELADDRDKEKAVKKEINNYNRKLNDPDLEINFTGRKFLNLVKNRKKKIK